MIQSEKEITRRTLMGWGCKKDSRVLDSENNNPTKISEIKMDDNFTGLSCGAHHTIAFTK